MAILIIYGQLVWFLLVGLPRSCSSNIVLDSTLTTNTYKRLPIANSPLPLNRPLWCRNAKARGVLVLGAISGTTSYWHAHYLRIGQVTSSTPSRVGSRWVSGWLVNAYLFTRGGVCSSSHSIHKAKEVGPQSTKKDNCWHLGGWYLGCEGIILQTNRMRSWRWPCDFVHRYS